MPPTTLTYDDATGQRAIAIDRASMTLGRSPDRDIVLHDPLVSRQHAVLQRNGNSWTIEDQNSTHGTFLNSVRVSRAALKSGDTLQLGSVHGQKLQFHIQPPEPTTTISSEFLDTTSFHDLLHSFQELQAPKDHQRPATRDMEQLNWLLRAARQLNEGIAIEDILGALLQLTLQLTCVERGFVYLWADGGMQFAQGVGAAGKITKEDQTISRSAIRKAIESNSTFFVSDTLSDQVTSEWSSVVINEIRSIYCIPLRKRVPAGEPSQLLGLLYLDSRIQPGCLTEIDHQLLDTIATEAAALLHNALLAEEEQKARQAREELAVAARIHSGLMSTELPVLPYAALQAKTVPCLAIGGDFYDVVVLEDCVSVTIVDISGKGVSAAIVAATLQGIIHAQLLARIPLPQIASMVNQFLCTRNVGKYATMILLTLFPDGSIEYVNCGHVQPLAIQSSDPDSPGRPSQIRHLEASNLIVGLIPGAIYTTALDAVRPGERLLLTTDGITEAENSQGELFGDSALNSVAASASLEAILDHVAKFHAPNPAQDDCTLLELRYTG
jgi:sigma-B regulation protein RsbU (phosphoserine phosphatase)